MTKVVSWNIHGASTRTDAMASRVSRYDADVVILSEAVERLSIFDILRERYPHMRFSAGDKKHRGSAILSKSALIKDETMPAILQGRCVSAETGGILYMALYGPATWKSLARHDAFWTAVIEYLASNANRDLLVSGDFNLGNAEADNEIGLTSNWKRFADPYYQKLTDLRFVDAWRQQHGADAREYSYYPHKRSGGKEPHGRRLDHLFVSANLAPRLAACSYDHGARTSESGKADSDHSAIQVDIGSA